MKTKRLIASLSLLLGITISGGAIAQFGPSTNGPMYNPNWTTGFVPTSFQWGLLWSNKMDYYVGGLPIQYGGTGATTANQALANLGGTTNVLPNTNIYVGNASNRAAAVPLSGDATITNTGNLSVNNLSHVTNASLANSGLVNTVITVNSVPCTLGSTCSIVAAASSISPSTTVSGITAGQVLYNNAGNVGGLASSGTGNLVRVATPTISDLTVTGSLTATGLIANSALQKSSMTVSGTTCTLGAACTPNASSISNTTTVSGITAGDFLINNGGTVGGVTPTGTGDVVRAGAPTVTGAWTHTGVTVTASAPLITGTQTWNNGAVGFSLLDFDVTNTASADPSYLIHLKIGGGSRFIVDKYGTGVFNDRGYFGGDLNIETGNALPAGGTAGAGLKMFNTTPNFGIFGGSGAPTLAAAQGSIYLRSDGAPFYNTDGSTGWTSLLGSGTVSAGTANQLGYYAANGTTISGLTTANNGLLVTNGSGAPSISSTIPNGVIATTQSALDNSTKVATTAYVDTAVQTGIPVGVCMAYGGATAPAGWAFAYGQAISRKGFASLFAVYSTLYGSGDGSTTFNMPDLRGRLTAGRDDMGGSAASRLTGTTMTPNGVTLGATGGTQTYTLSTGEIPAHAHGPGTYSTAGHSHTASGLGVVGNNLANGTNRAVGTGDGVNAGAFQDVFITVNAAGALSVNAGSSSNAGGGGAHPVIQPTMVMNQICKTQ